jgi:hypothetical protein
MRQGRSSFFGALLAALLIVGALYLVAQLT